MRVQEIASKHVAACAPETTLANAGWLMWENDCGVLPVLVDGKATTVITDRDIAIAAATRYRPAAEIPVREVANGALFACRPTDDVRDALQTMKAQRIRRLPVVDAEGRPTGVLSINDVIRVAKPTQSARPGEITYDDVVQTLQAISAPWSAAEKSAKEEPVAATAGAV